MARNSALFDVKVVEKTIRDGMQSAVDYNFNTLRAISKTWNHEPIWYKKVRMEGGDLVGEVATGDDAFRYLDEGTTKRYMHLSRDWRSKTSPRSFTSGMGGGRTTGIHKKFPRKGITAREWTDIQRGRSEVFLQKQIDLAMDYISQYNMKTTSPSISGSSGYETIGTNLNTFRK